ncbi:MAG TPA: hypothetical protein VMY78_00820 [Solirubrobacteraceae bacterium]|nr:hypothetical protein [Solirubrobacteraceae bacterium]
MPKFRLAALALPATVLALAAGASPAVAAIDTDQVYAATTGVKVQGTLSWLDFAGHIEFNVVVSDTLVDGRCADLYVRQRNPAVSSGWSYIGHACGGGTAVRFARRNIPFQGGTSGYDFRITRSEGGPSAYDYNALMGD